MCDIISLYQKNKGVLSMNILSQILNYETKNLFIDDILEKIKAKLTNAILSILTNFSKNKYIKSFLNLQKEVNNLIIELIIDFISRYLSICTSFVLITKFFKFTSKDIVSLFHQTDFRHKNIPFPCVLSLP